MDGWRMKVMSLAEAERFQAQVQDRYIALGAPADAGLFQNDDASDRGRTRAMVLAPTHASAFEALSPGGWTSLDPFSVRSWIALICQADTADRLGIALGRR